MNDNDALKDMLRDIDPTRHTADAPPAAADPMLHRIMAADRRPGPGDARLTPSGTRSWHRPALIAGVVVVLALVVAAMMYWPSRATSGSTGNSPAGRQQSDPKAGPGSSSHGGPINFMRLTLPADAAPPLTGCLDAWANWIPPDQVTVGPTGDVLGSWLHDPSIPAPSGQPWPTLTITDPHDGYQQNYVASTGVISVYSSVRYGASVTDDHTIVLFGPTGQPAVTLTDLGPDTPQVQVRDAGGTLLGAVDYSADGGQINVSESASFISVGSAWLKDPPKGQNGQPANTMLFLLWSAASGVVLTPTEPDPTLWVDPQPYVTDTNESVPQPTQAPAELALALTTTVGDTTVGVFSSSAGTGLCATIPDGAGGFTYRLSYQPDYFNADLAAANPQGVYFVNRSMVDYWPDLLPDNHSFITGGLGADVTGLVITLSDQTQVTADIQAPYWAASFTRFTPDGVLIDPVTVTATLADGTTRTFGWA